MPDNRRISSPKILPKSTWSSENFSRVNHERKAVIRKFINSAIYVEKSVMPPLRKKSPIEVSSFSDSECTSRIISTDRSVKRCRCLSCPQNCPCHPLSQGLNPIISESVSEHSTTSSSDLGSQITVKSKDRSKDITTELKLSLNSLHSDRTNNIDPKEKEEYIKNWLRKKDEERKKKDLAETKFKTAKEQEKQMILEKERENFKKWLANKKIQEEKAKEEKEAEEKKNKITELKNEQRRAMNQSTYNQWLNQKKRAELGIIYNFELNVIRKLLHYRRYKVCLDNITFLNYYYLKIFTNHICMKYSFPIMDFRHIRTQKLFRIY